MTRYFTIGLLALGLALVSATSAQAGAVSELVNNVVNELEDEDFEQFFPSANHVAGGPFVEGDRFLGVFEIQRINAPPPNLAYDPGANDPTFTAVFALEVARVVENAASATLGSADFVYFRPIGTTDWNTAFGLPAGTIPIASTTGTMIQVFDDVTSATTNAATGSLAGSIATFVGTNRAFEFGFTAGDADGDGITDAGEFWIAHGGPTTSVPGNALSTIQNVINLNITGDSAIVLLPHTFLDGSSFDTDRAEEAGADFGVAAQAQAQGGIQPGGATDFGFGTDTNVYVVPVPEPASLTLFALGGLACGAVARRRRRTNA
jgi:hypothetical protein